MYSNIVGRINPVDGEEDYFESEPYPVPYFDYKLLKVVFVEAKYEPYLTQADTVLRAFLNLSYLDRLNDSQTVLTYYKQTVDNGYASPLNIRTAGDIWNFVSPSLVIIQWDENGNFYLCVSSKCEWEEEHGLELVFKDGKRLTKAGGHDGTFGDE